MQIADLQIHSKYSRATSPNMVLEEIAKGARTKGLNIVGTGDFTHPIWLKELKRKLTSCDNGLFSFNAVQFMLTGEISLMYTKNKKGRRIHHGMKLFGRKGITAFFGQPAWKCLQSASPHLYPWNPVGP